MSQLEERVRNLEYANERQRGLIQEMGQSIQVLLKAVPDTVTVLQYNILASYLGKNTQPWFLYGAEVPCDLRQKVMNKYNERDEKGKPKNSWPTYAEGLLPPEAISAVEEQDKNFQWDVRKHRLVDEILQHDADIISLVELDQYGFFRESLGDRWSSVFHKRPRTTSLDGCGVFWRESKFALLEWRGLDFLDSLDKGGRAQRDRSCLMVLLQWRASCNPLVVVSTHLARNPEDRAQTAVRVRQVAQLVEWLTEFTDDYKVSDAPVILLGDLNAQHFGEIRGIARTVWQIKGDPMHPFLWTASDVPTGPTSITKARQVRIDVVQYTSSQLEVVDVTPVPRLAEGLVIPNDKHPSDHFPVCARFVLKNSYQKHKEYARAWLECVAGRQKVHPLTEQELVLAFEFFDRDRSRYIHRHDLEEACVELRVVVHGTMQRLLLECFPDQQISYPNFVKAYEVRLNHERMRSIGDLEHAFQFLAEDSHRIPLSRLEEAFRQITPISFTDDEVRQMIRRMTCRKSQQLKPIQGKNGEDPHNLPEDDHYVDLHSFCEAVCRSTFQHKGVRRRGSGLNANSMNREETWGMAGTRELSTNLQKLEKALITEQHLGLVGCSTSPMQFDGAREIAEAIKGK